MKNWLPFLKKFAVPLAGLVISLGAFLVFRAPIVAWFGMDSMPARESTAPKRSDTKGSAPQGSGTKTSASSPADPATPINTICPILEDPIPADAATVTWNGHVIGFCCPPCDVDWNALPEAEKQAFVDQSLAASASGTPPPRPAKSKRPAPKAEDIAFHTCSMHPSVKSQDPGTCPICKMDLTPVTHEEVRDGIIFVDKRRSKLINLRTAPVEPRALVREVRAVGRATYDETTLRDITFENQRLNRVWVEVAVYESDLALIQQGQIAQLTLSHLPGVALEGEVVFIDPWVDPKTRTARARIVVDNADGRLKPDLFAEARIQVPLGEHPAIPAEAVLHAGETDVVFVDLGEDRIRPQKIDLGHRAGEWVQVRKGLKPGDVIVTSGNFLVASESKLKSGKDSW